MSYTVTNFKTKKALKEAIKVYNDQPEGMFGGTNKKALLVVRCYQPGLGPDLSNYTGSVSLEGPHYPKAHTWYAIAEMKDGIVIKVK
jgi:hypothetical protein